MAIMDEEGIKRSSELLLQGATMLQLSCPVCHQPLYRLREGQIRCAQCDRQVVIEKEMTDHQRKELSMQDNPIKAKIDKLTKQLETEEDPDKIIKLAETIRKLQDIL